MNKTLQTKEIKIENMIYEIRGKQVMLDSDLAKLYNVETKRINEAVYRNKEKFPERFSFILNESDLTILRSQIATSKNHGGRRYSIRVFTEQGIAMLATILKSKIAVDISIQIMDAFVTMRKYISDNLLVQRYYNDMIIRHDNEIKLLQTSFKKIEENKKVTEIYFNGQIYDAYSKILDIFKAATNELIIIDSYADKLLLDIIRRLPINVSIITRKNGLLNNLDIERYNRQYKNLTVKYDNTFHDRYFILDKKIIYHCGASINRIGYKTFSINIINDNVIKEGLLDKIKNLNN